MDLIHLPLNMALVDCWILLGTPLLWLAFVRGRYVLSWLYALPMWLIFVASFASIFATPDPTNSLVVLLKEIYAYIWFVTLTAVLARLNNKDLQWVLVVWAAMMLLHGFVIIGQFVSPALWHFTMSIADSVKGFDVYRPSGLLMNANSAALFQLFGFVPLALVSRSQKVTMSLALLLLPSMLLTGSMGAALAFCTGFMVAMLAIVWSGYLAAVIKTFAQLALALAVLGALLFILISQNERYQNHFERIFFGRSEKSSEGRFDLWQRGLDVFVEYNVFLWGVGPENFRELDRSGHDNQLHNDFLAFLVERGLLGSLGLGLLALVSLSRAAYMVLLRHKYPDRVPLNVVVFLAAIVATMVESLTHQVFHFRELWLVLAMQEAMFFKIRNA
jgi:O-antigen ligase